MIRINLLPVRAAQKKESVRFQLTVGGLITFFVFSLSVAGYLTLKGEVSSLSGDISRSNKELVELKKKVGELSKIKEQKKVVEEKLKVINDLETARRGPMRLFNDLSDSIPEKAWLQSMKDDGHIVILQGFADADETVAEFMRRLQKISGLGTVELEVAQRTLEKETGVELVAFTIRLERGAKKS